MDETNKREQNQQLRWGVVYSSHSGSHKAHKRWAHIRRYMEMMGVQYDFVQSESYGSVERLVTMLCQNGYHTIVIVGGDGALNDEIQQLCGEFREFFFAKLAELFPDTLLK